MKKYTRGFSLPIAIGVILAVGVLGLIGWRILSSNQQQIATPSQSTTANNAAGTQKTTTTLNLANESVKFEIPHSWEVEKGACVTPVSQKTSCLEGAKLVPSEKMPTIYGDGHEYFTIYASVYNNPNNMTPQSWFETIYDAGFAMSGSQGSHDSINGYATYYYRQVNDSYDEINYVYSHSNKSVLVKAQVSMTHYAPGGNHVVDSHVDFTQYVPAIEAMAKSIAIK